MPADELNTLKEKIRTDKINSWDAVHNHYVASGKKYPGHRLRHALASLLEIEGLGAREITDEKVNEWLVRAVTIASSLVKRISESREKDYTNPFRKMVYDSEAEMTAVVGVFGENSFIKQKQKELRNFKKTVESLRGGKKLMR